MAATREETARALIVEAIMAGGKLVSDFPFKCPACGTICSEGNPCVDDMGLGFAVATADDATGRQTCEGITAACTNCRWAGTPKRWAWVVEESGDDINQYWTPRAT